MEGLEFFLAHIFFIIEIFLLFQQDLATITNLNHKSDTQATDLLATIHQQYIKLYLYDGRKKLLKKIQEHRRLSKSNQDFTLFLDSSYGQQVHHNTPWDLCFEPQVYLLASTHRQNANYNSNNNNKKAKENYQMHLLQATKQWKSIQDLLLGKGKPHLCCIRHHLAWEGNL